MPTLALLHAFLHLALALALGLALPHVFLHFCIWHAVHGLGTLTINYVQQLDEGMSCALLLLYKGRMPCALYAIRPFVALFKIFYIRPTLYIYTPFLYAPFYCFVLA